MLYPKEQTMELFEKLPRELRAAIFSEDNADYIRQIAERYKITDKVKELAILVGNILLGLLSPDTLGKAMEQELQISTEKTSAISQEINRLILYPVKDKLIDFYKEISFAPSGAITQLEKQKIVVGASQDENIENITPDELGGDTYREMID
ncbi:hypothetical protein COT20_02470 [bacterium (Candidatus Gribaldobacteria) CG08_land_8_20_14_0_20_39_15]|uniref:Uncharacterized protein n=1 Tax=bacterium (Candidatus Gribaldobacteria) CG08_land_8_20_14_0_20_39_15 TaxID=2014273 RepID=A0A2M6XU58_9BACT|nr:MAG: hypothetical protein COX43_01825 [Parcubacteria group bacterium CG23_combo_of_CG06-09_8_20_14_all_35_9]PIU14721.1 MAG: hypothetical protein COT20_02470 [bacterium (Candidatus Gribaldobacteria) CG08_land_8_20_14_0_20_39_15]